jgi:hypothetical protein
MLMLLCAQGISAQVLILGNGSFTGSSLAGPANTSTSANASSRYAYIFPQSVVSGLLHNDSIRSISFMRNGGGALVGTCSLKVYMRTTVNSNYGNRNVNWVNLTGTTGMKKVYDKSPSNDFDSVDGWVRLVFNTPYVVDTVFGKNLEILVEYNQISSQNSNIFWNFENSGTVSGYAANQTKFVRSNGGTITDTTNSSTEWHPTIRIEFPRSDFDLSVLKLYSLGKLPIPNGNPDTVKAIVQNVGKKPATFKMYLRSAGANNLYDSALYTLGYLEEKLLRMPLLNPTNLGLDTLTASVQNDQGNTNNSVSGYRLATSNIYSYKDPTRPIVGGIGFNGTSGDFVAKFFSGTADSINQISVSFAGSNQKFKLGIWKADGKGGSPGTNVWTSDTLITSPSFVTPVMPPVPIKESFYVGVRQIGTVNVAFGYQPELPVRRGTFYYAAPMGDTSWVDFAPDAPFKFAIEPRLQMVNDVAPIKVLVPKDTVKLLNIVKMAPKVSVLNYGSANQSKKFNVKLNIFRYGNLEYTSTRSDSLSSGLKRTIVFDSSFLPTQAGDYDIQVVTLLSNDEMRDNDTLRSKFIVAVYKDVGPTTIFDPSNGYDYEQFVDTIYPTVFIQNYGLDKQGPFNVRAEIYDSSNVLIYSDVRSFTLTPLNSILASFKIFPCDIKGIYHFRAYSELGIDIDKTNDTVRRTFKIVRSNDVAITSIVYPANNQSLSPPVASKNPEAVLENLGDFNQADPFTSICDIYFNNNLIYRDSISLNCFRTIPQSLIFKTFKPTLKGYYTMMVYSNLGIDQYRANDTLKSVFAVGVPDDVELVSISPNINSVLQLNKVYPTQVTVRNNGYFPQNTPFPLIFKVSNGVNIQYLKVKLITIDSGETKTITLDTTLKLDNLSQYNVEVYTSLNKDFIKVNDSIKGFYNTAKSYDIGASRIIFPTVNDTLLTNIQDVESIVEVVKYGDSSVSDRFSTTLQIFNKLNKVLLYSMKLDSSMNGKDTLRLKFPSFGIGSVLSVSLKSFTTWTKDQYNLNDTCRGESRFMVLYDAVAVSVTKPLNLQTYLKSEPSITPQVRINNGSKKVLSDFYGVLKINELDTVNLTEKLVYIDSTYIQNLLPSESREIDMLKVLSFAGLNKGRYKVYLNVYYPMDQVPSNNVFQTTFRVDEKSSIVFDYTGGINLYPNPSKNVLYVDLLDAELLNEKIEIVDIHGKIVKTLRADQAKLEINPTELSSGIYTLKIGVRLIKFVVEK